jgi:hypothetical protein
MPLTAHQVAEIRALRGLVDWEWCADESEQGGDEIDL